MKEVMVGVVLLFALIVLAWILDLGFYAPVRGEVAPGQNSKPGETVSRGTAKVTVEGRMSPEEGRAPTLREIVSFFGLEQDTIPCTVAENQILPISEGRVEELAGKEQELDEELVLCLN
ncbi:MAG: hypothetical protein GY856_39890 [bacterium]|nr:hypothetical protein [bacterium]